MEAYQEEMAKNDKPFTLEWVDAGHSSDDKEITQQQQQMRMEFALETLKTSRAERGEEEKDVVVAGVATTAKARL
eukprot:SAG22_NODE_651_length_8155_cov_20.230884_8_plen_75_part_00